MSPWIKDIKTTPSVYSVIPTLAKVHLAPLCFYERPMLVPIFANQNKSEEHFHF